MAGLYLSITASAPIEEYRSRGDADSRGDRLIMDRKYYVPVVPRRTENEYRMNKESIHTYTHAETH